LIVGAPLRRYLVSVDVAIRNADQVMALARYDAFLAELGLEVGKLRQARAYAKGDVNSRVFGTAAIWSVDFAGVVARMRRVDAAIFGRSPAKPSRYFKVLAGAPAGAEIVGPSSDDPIGDPDIVWVNIEAEDSPEWDARLTAFHDKV